MKIKTLFIITLLIAATLTKSTIPMDPNLDGMVTTYTRLDDKPAPDEPTIKMLKEILQRLNQLEKLSQQLEEIKKHLQVLITK